MKINFNRDNITKYLIIGGVSILTLVTGVKFSSDAKKNSKPVNTKDNKQYEVENDKVSNIASSNNVYYAEEWYHVEGTMAVKNGYHLERQKCVSNIIMLNETDRVYDSHTKAAPVGYHKEILYDDCAYFIKDNYHLETIDNISYAVYDGYPVIKQDGNIVSVKDGMTMEENTELNQLTIDGVTYSAPEGYTLEVRVGVVLAVRTVVKKEIRPLEVIKKNDKKYYIAPEGYTVVGEYAVKEIQVTETMMPTMQKVLTK